LNSDNDSNKQLNKIISTNRITPASGYSGNAPNAKNRIIHGIMKSIIKANNLFDLRVSLTG
jgi:hypothetical protein